jgi:hypothetical protein
MLVLYLLLLGGVALFTAYTRNFQRTVVTLAGELGGTQGPLVTPRRQLLRTLAVLLVWPAAVGVGIAFFAWWKAIGLVVAAFLLLVPALGALTPRAMSAHYLEAIRADLEQRLAAGGTDAAELRQILARLAQRGAPAG